MRWKLILIVLFLCSFFVAKPAFAQTTPYTAVPLNMNPDVPVNNHTYTQNVVIDLLAAVSCQLSGVDPISPAGKCLGIDIKTGKLGYTENTSGGAIGFMGNLITMTFNIPISTHDYVQNIAGNFGITKRSYAQGPGCDPADPTCVTDPNVQKSLKPVTGFEGTLCQDSGDCQTGFICSNAQTGQERGSCVRIPPDYTPSKGAISQPHQSFDQGIGFAGLSPLLPLWRAFRNITYLFFVLIFVIVGLGIMLRIRIDPRTVMTLQNQIPKIIVALVLVTFSYAIAGFLIDMMYLAMYLIFGIFSNVISVQTYNPIVLQNSNVINTIGSIGGIGKISANASSNIVDVLGSLFAGNIGSKVAAILGGIIGGGAAIASAPLGPLAPVVGFLVGVGSAVVLPKLISLLATMIAFLVIAIALLVALFRLWFTLLKAYIYILIYVVLAPIWIAIGLIPGTPLGFGSWFKSVVANLAVFPVTMLMFLFAKVFIDQFAKAPGGFVPPFIGNPGDVKSFGALIGVGIILMTPEVANIVRDTLKAPSLKYTAAAGQILGAGAGLPLGVARGVGQLETARREVMITKVVAGAPQYGPRGIGRAILGTIFRR